MFLANKTYILEQGNEEPTMGLTLLLNSCTNTWLN